MQPRGSPSVAFAIRWDSVVLIAWAPPFIPYWMFPPDVAAWKQLHVNHGPWREGVPGRVFVIFYLVLIVIVPGVLARGALLSIRARVPSPLLIALGLAVLSIGLLWHQLAALFWLIA
jgi:hypothetical protein